MRKIIERAVVLLAALALVLGLVPKNTMAAGNDLVPVSGEIVDLTSVNHKHLNLCRGGAGCNAFTIKECPDRIKTITVPANTSDYECSVPVDLDEVYDINVINGDKLNYTISNGLGSSYEGSDNNKTFTYQISKTNGIKLKISNATDTEKRISVLVMPNNTIYTKNSLTHITVGKNTRFTLNFTNLPEGEYALSIKFYTDSTFSTMTNKGKFTWDSVNRDTNSNGYIKISGKNDVFSGTFKTPEKAYISFSLAKVTDISDYDTVENNDLYDYTYKTKESGVYMAHKAYDVGTSAYSYTKSFKYFSKGTVLETKSLEKQGLSYVSYKKLSDISTYSGVKDTFQVVDNSYLFCPSATDDYYFTSDIPLHYLVTDIVTGDSVENDNTCGAHLEKGKQYAVTVSITKGSLKTYEFRICKKAVASSASTGSDMQFGDFVERLYLVALNRQSEKEGKDFWCLHVGNGELTGAACAKEFLLSKEFQDRKLSDEEFVKVLYKTFFDRNAEEDPNGYSFWLNTLKKEGRDKAVEGFINSEEWCNLCAAYGVKSGSNYVKASDASQNAISFATRLYTECLGREPEQEGLKYWSLGLTNHELTGTQAAKEFFYSAEYKNKNLGDSEYLDTLYKTFMGRDPESEGKAYWMEKLGAGMSRDEVFNSFSGSQEFTQICKDYAIER